jgi:hypothetical protein
MRVLYVDWLRVGRSFKGAVDAHGTPEIHERALQVYSKSKKRSRERQRERRSGSDSDRESRHSHKRGSDYKKKRKAKKTKRKKKDKSRRRDHSDVESSSSSSRRSSDSDRRQATKRKRRDDERERGRRLYGADEVARSRRPATNDELSELALLEAPAHGTVEVYRSKRGDGQHGEKLFEFDCAGDRENVMFGTLYTHEQPLYRLATRRSVVDGTWIVAKPNGHKQESGQPKQADANRYFGKTAKAIEKRTATKRFHLAYSQRRLARLDRGGATDEMAFIPLDALVDGELEGVIPDDTETLPDEALPLSESAKLLWQTDLENVERFIVTRQKELNERVAANPHDIDAWLDVIAFQDQTLRLSGAKRTNDNGSILEKQQAVWAKAFEKNPTSSRLRQLQLNLLWRQQQASGAVNETDSYRSLVDKLLESDRTNEELWAKLIQSAQQKFGSFSMTMLRDLYARVISVLNKELREQVQTSEPVSAATSRSSSAFVHVIGTKSLLGRVDPYHSDALSEEALRLSESLMIFHWSMMCAEVSAGYTERAVALAQALVEFNGVGQTNSHSASESLHHAEIESFTSRWNGSCSHFGEGSRVEPAFAMAQLPDINSMHAYCSAQTDRVLRHLNVPEMIRSPQHELDLVGAFGDDESESIDQGNALDPRTREGARTESGGRWVYSNLHGQRIWIADADESQEYERILSELRGSEKAREYQDVQNLKEKSKNEKRLDLLKKRRDERADYVSIDPDMDEAITWLMRETEADILQWKPLQASNPEHADIIEMQPDRAILTEDILPFVFRVPRLLHFSVVMNLLKILGLRMAAPTGTPEEPTQLLSLDDFSHFSLFTTPVLRALDPCATDLIAMSSRDRYNMVMLTILRHVDVSEITARDPGRAQFIRNIFVAALDHFTPQFDPVARVLKAMWMEFEAELLLQAGISESATTRLRSFCQELLSQPGQQMSGAVDAWLMSVYAAIELRLSNERQMARICDKTMVSLDLVDAASSTRLCRSFHRLIFMRVHQLLSANNDRLGALKAFYLLWQVWAPRSSATLDMLLKQYRRAPAEFEARLQTHLEQHEIEIIGKYRIELQIALEQCGRNPRLQTGPPNVSCSVAFALANVSSAVYISRGFQAAKDEFDHFLGDTSTVTPSCHGKQCWHMLFAFMQAHGMSGRHPLLAPREWRETVARGVATFPHEPFFLRLFVDAETSNTMSQSLRKYFQSRRQAWQRSLDSPALTEWLFALLCEFARAERGGIKITVDLPLHDAKDRSTCCVLHRWGKNRPAVERIRRVFEEMMSQLKTSGCAIGWRLYLRFELAVGKVDAARKVFYRGLAKCPWSKALHLDGLRVLRPYLSQIECDEISEFLAAKELHVRVDV